MGGKVSNQNHRSWEALTGRLQRSWMPEPRWEWRVILIKLIPSKPQHDVIQCLLIRDSCPEANTNSHSVVNVSSSHRTNLKIYTTLNYGREGIGFTRMTNKWITFVVQSAQCASDEMALDSPTCKNAHFHSRFPTKLHFSSRGFNTQLSALFLSC